MYRRSSYFVRNITEHKPVILPNSYCSLYILSRQDWTNTQSVDTRGSRRGVVGAGKRFSCACSSRNEHICYFLFLMGCWIEFVEDVSVLLYLFSHIKLIRCVSISATISCIALREVRVFRFPSASCSPPGPNKRPRTRRVVS